MKKLLLLVFVVGCSSAFLFNKLTEPEILTPPSEKAQLLINSMLTTDDWQLAKTNWDGVINNNAKIYVGYTRNIFANKAEVLVLNSFTEIHFNNNDLKHLRNTLPFAKERIEQRQINKLSEKKEK